MSWTPEHAAFVEKKLPIHGHTWCAKRIGKDPSAVWAWADRRGIRFGEIPGWIPASTVAQLTGASLGNIITRADREGASRRLGKRKLGRNEGAKRVIVKEAWAERLIREYDTTNEASEARGVGYLSVNDARDLWRVSRSTIIRGLNGEGVLASHLKTARTIRGARGVWLINPHDAERIRRELQAERDLAKRLVSSKVIAAESGMRQSDVAMLAREYGGRLLFTGGPLTTYLTPQQADRLRARLARNAHRNGRQQPELEQRAA